MAENIPSSYPAQNATDSAAAGNGFKLFDNLFAAIIGGAILVSLIMIFVMFPGYLHARNTALADRYYARGQYELAIPYLNRIVTKYPGAWARYQMMGDCYMLTHHFKDAMNCYQMVLQSPGYLDRVNNPSVPSEERLNLDLNEEIGICASELGDEKKAQDCFAKVAAQEPDSPAMNFYMGVQYLKAGNYRQAAHCFQNTATGDHAAVETNDTEIPKQASKWGDYWDKQAEPYRRELAKRVLETPLAAPQAPKPGGQKG